MRMPVLLVVALAWSASALAQDRDFCANRPGRGTPSCTMAPGEAMIEMGAAEWDHSSDGPETDDSETFGDLLLRMGVSQSAEVQFGLTSYNRGRDLDRTSGQVTHSNSVGDLFFGVRRGFTPNGPVAIEGFVTAPPDHLGDWSAGLLLPTGLDLPSGFQLALSPEIDLAADADGHGRHVAYGGVVGLSHALAANLSMGGELAAIEDNDPAGHSLDARLVGELAWQVAPRFQVDFEADAGLSAGAPDSALMIGFASRFR